MPLSEHLIKRHLARLYILEISHLKGKQKGLFLLTCYKKTSMNLFFVPQKILHTDITYNSSPKIHLDKPSKTHHQTTSIAKGTSYSPQQSYKTPQIK